MAVKSNLRNMVLCLTAVCLVCSALLAGAYSLTKSPIEAAAKAKTEKSLSAVLPAFQTVEESVMDGIRYYTAKNGNETVGYAIESGTIGFGGPLTLMVGIASDGTVYNTSVLSHNETPGLGAKCTSDKKFMDQWQGLDPAQKILSVKKDGGDIDAITASTITSRAYARAVAGALDVYKKIMEGESHE